MSIKMTSKIKDIFKNKNVILFLVLVSALIFTYVFEEKRNKDFESSEKKRLAILNVEDLGGLQSFKGIKLDILKKGEEYYSVPDNIKLSDKKLDELFKILGGLKVKKILTPDEIKNTPVSVYIPNQDLQLEFQFLKGNLKFSLGKKLDYDQNFYMQVTKDNQTQIMIVTDESPDPNVYQTDDSYKRSDFKYNRLQMLFYLTNVFFYETRPFMEFNYADDKINFQNIEIATFRNKKFKINFEKSITEPAAPTGVPYFEENWISFHRTLTSLEAKTLYFPFDQNKLSEPLSIFTIKDRSSRNYTLEVYKKYGSLSGYFLKTSFNQYLYELRAEEAKYFFVNVQDFWMKHIPIKDPEYDFTIQFTKENSVGHKLKIKDAEVFNVESSEKVKNENFKKLIDFIKSTSDHLDEVKESPLTLQKKLVMKLSFLNRNIGVSLEENDVVLVDLNTNVQYHHYVGENISFSLRESEYFEK